MKYQTNPLQYLPFTFWFISIIILTILAIIVMPLIWAYNKIDSIIRERESAYAFYIRGMED